MSLMNQLGKNIDKDGIDCRAWKFFSPLKKMAKTIVDPLEHRLYSLMDLVDKAAYSGTRRYSESIYRR